MGNNCPAILQRQCRGGAGAHAQAAAITAPWINQGDRSIIGLSHENAPKQNSLKVWQPYTLSERLSTTFIGFLFNHLSDLSQRFLIQNLDLMTLHVEHSLF
jgi:hypothetical protein